MKKEKGASLIALVIVILIIIAIGIVVFVVINNNKVNDVSINEQITEDISKNPESNINNSNNSNSSEQLELNEYTKVGGKSIYINYKSSRRTNTASTSIVFFNNKSDIIDLMYNDNSTFNGSISEAFSLLNNGKLFWNIASRSEADFRQKGKDFIISVKSQENITINDIQTIRFTGYVSDNNDKECFVYGYVFVLDNTPLMLTGTLTGSQEQSLKDSIISEVDAMMKTVRTKY